jgi:hypothetical protein
MWMRAVVLFLVFGCILLSSKLMIAILVFLLLLRSVHYAHSLRTAQITLGTIAVICVTIGTIIVIPQTRERFSTELASDFTVLNQDTFRYDTPFSGTSLRVQIWKLCVELLNENRAWITGVGIGDLQDKLDEKYRQKGMYTGNPELKDSGYLGYGPHNQYMEILTAMGGIAVFFFGFVISLLWQRAVVRNHFLLPGFLLLITLFFITESVLGTAKGILFFMFFTTLFVTREDLASEKRNP